MDAAIDVVIRCRTAGRVCWKMTLTRGVETLAARCQRTTAHGMRIQSAVVTAVKVCVKVEVVAWGVAVPVDVLIEV